MQTEFHVWTLIVFGVHWCIALLWLVLQDSASESGLKTPSPAVSLFRRALVAYVLVFDWPPRYQQVSTFNYHRRFVGLGVVVVKINNQFIDQFLDN